MNRRRSFRRRFSVIKKYILSCAWSRRVLKVKVKEFIVNEIYQCELVVGSVHVTLLMLVRILSSSKFLLSRILQQQQLGQKQWDKGEIKNKQGRARLIPQSPPLPRWDSALILHPHRRLSTHPPLSGDALPTPPHEPEIQLLCFPSSQNLVPITSLFTVPNPSLTKYKRCIATNIGILLTCEAGTAVISNCLSQAFLQHSLFQWVFGTLDSKPEDNPSFFQLYRPRPRVTCVEFETRIHARKLARVELTQIYFLAEILSVKSACLR